MTTTTTYPPRPDYGWHIDRGGRVLALTRPATRGRPHLASCIYIGCVYRAPRGWHAARDGDGDGIQGRFTTRRDAAKRLHDDWCGKRTTRPLTGDNVTPTQPAIVGTLAALTTPYGRPGQLPAGERVEIITEPYTDRATGATVVKCTTTYAGEEWTVQLCDLKLDVEPADDREPPC